MEEGTMPVATTITPGSHKVIMFAFKKASAVFKFEAIESMWLLETENNWFGNIPQETRWMKQY